MRWCDGVLWSILLNCRFSLNFVFCWLRESSSKHRKNLVSFSYQRLTCGWPRTLRRSEPPLSQKERRRSKIGEGMARGAQKRRKENNFCFNFSINFHSFVSSPFGSSARCRVRSRCLCCRSSIAEISQRERKNIFQFNKTGAHTAAAYYAHTKLYILWRASCALNQVQWTFFPRPDDDDDDNARWDDVKNLNIMRHDDFFPWEKRRNGPRGLVWTSQAWCCNMSKWEIYSSHPSRCFAATSSASRNDIKLYLAHFSHRASHLPALDFPHLVRVVMDESLKMIERAQTRKKRSFWVMTHA